jgi:hypothetical protein
MDLINYKNNHQFIKVFSSLHWFSNVFNNFENSFDNKIEIRESKEYDLH